MVVVAALAIFHKELELTSFDPTHAAVIRLDRTRYGLLMLLATLIAEGSGIVGLFASYYASVSSGAATVLTCTTCFGLAWVINVLRRTRQVTLRTYK